MNERTLTRGEALDTIDAAEQMGALGYLAAHWNMAGSWNENATWTAEQLRDYVDECCIDGDRIRSYGPSDSDETDLAEWEGLE